MTTDIRKDILHVVASHCPRLDIYKITDEVVDLIGRYQNDRVGTEMKLIDVYGLPDREY